MLVFFGFVATVGSAYVQVKDVPSAGVVGLARRRAARVRDPPRQQRARRPDRRGHRASARSRCASARTTARRLFVACYVGSFAVGGDHRHLAALGPARACSRCRSRWRRCARSSPAHDPPSLVAGAGGDVEGRGRGRGAGERGAVPVLNEHRLRLGDRADHPARGAGGLGRVLAARPATRATRRCAGAAAEEAATRGLPTPRCATSVPVNALVDGPFLVQDVARLPGGEGEGARRGRRRARARGARRGRSRRRVCGSTPTARGTSTPRSR